jgi:hypothetical protein
MGTRANAISMSCRKAVEGNLTLSQSFLLCDPHGFEKHGDAAVGGEEASLPPPRAPELERSDDGGERGGNTTLQRLQTYDQNNRHEGDDESVLNETLTFIFLEDGFHKLPHNYYLLK